jgi:hypothetical protein
MKHPKFAPALRKEIHFFDQHFEKGWMWYLSHFPVREEGILSGEASPHYYFFPEAAQRVAECLPNAKLIMLLRNPVDRAYSHYRHEITMGYERRAFHEAQDREFTFTDGVWKRKDLLANGTSQYVHFSYLSKGVYVTYLKKWMEKIPPERFLILKSERLFSEPHVVFPLVLNFLGVPQGNISTFPTYNEGNYEPLDNELKSQLQAFFAPYNLELSQFLGMDFSEWT